MDSDLTLEKLKVDERLGSLETKVDVLISKVELKHDFLEDNIKKLNHIVIGNGEVGLVEKVNNVKEKVDGYNKYGQSVLSTITVVVISSIIAFALWKMGLKTS